MDTSPSRWIWNAEGDRWNKTRDGDNIGTQLLILLSASSMRFKGVYLAQLPPAPSISITTFGGEFITQAGLEVDAW
jgi:hypothetical protein